MDFQNFAASKASEKATVMEQSREALAALKADIDPLLKKEDALRQIATGYTNIESAHVYWMDLLSELRGGFASDAVWLIDIEPLAGYNPLAEMTKGTPGKADSKNPTGKPIIKADFTATAYGTSSLVEIKTDEEAPAVGRKTAAPASKVPTANAVRIKGYWRDTEKKEGVVSELLKNLRERSTVFNFKVKDAKGAEVALSDDRILSVTVAGNEGDLGLPFEITLPLAKEVVIK